MEVIGVITAISVAGKVLLGVLALFGLAVHKRDAVKKH